MLWKYEKAKIFRVEAGCSGNAFLTVGMKPASEHFYIPLYMPSPSEAFEKGSRMMRKKIKKLYKSKCYNSR